MAENKKFDAVVKEANLSVELIGLAVFVACAMQQFDAVKKNKDAA